MTIESLVRAVLSRTLPARIASEAVAELLDEYDHRRTSRGVAVASVWLLADSVAMMTPFVLSALRRVSRSSIVVRRDVAHGVRALLRRPVSSASAVVMLAAGLAAVATAWGLGSALLFRPISTRYPGEVHRLVSTDRAGRMRPAFSEVELATIRDHMPGQGTVVAANLQPVVLRNGDTEVQTLAEVVAGPYFDTIGLGAAAGRPLMASDAAAGAAPVLVISDVIWRDWFARDPGVLGATVTVNGRAFTVVGVAAGASTSSLLSGSVDAWLSVAHADAVLDRTWRTNPDSRWWAPLIRVDHSSRAELDSALERATQDLAARLPDPWRERTIVVVPGTVLAGGQRDAAATLAAILLAFAILILAAAAANVSGLFLATAAAGRGRAAIQLAIGSGRIAVLRRHLIEGLILGGASGLVALALYVWAGRQLGDVALLPTLALRLDLAVDRQILALTIAAGSLAGLCLALGPGLWLTRLDVAHILRDGAGRSTGGALLSRSRKVLVAFQVAISIVLIAGATLFERTAAALSSLDVGFPRDGLIAMDFDLEPAVATADEVQALARQALARAQAVPAVVAATMSNRAPIDSSTPTVTLDVPASSDTPLADVTFYLATERYFETLGLPLVAGRPFTAEEADRGSDVVIVNETLANHLWPEGDALERHLRLQPQARDVRVIGVARDSKYRSLAEPARPHLYLPAAPSFGRSLLVRTREDPRRTILALQDALRDLGPGVIGFFPRTLGDHVAVEVLPARISARAASLLATLALLLSATGLYAVVSWFVEVRRREIGVRIALGATTDSVRWLIVRQAFEAAGPGIMVGVCLAGALTLVGRSLFVGIAPIDPSSLSLGIGAVGLVVVVASYWPSRKATRIDPAIVLRDP